MEQTEKEKGEKRSALLNKWNKLEDLFSIIALIWFSLLIYITIHIIFIARIIDPMNVIRNNNPTINIWILIIDILIVFMILSLWIIKIRRDAIMKQIEDIKIYYNIKPQEKIRRDVGKND